MQRHILSFLSQLLLAYRALYPDQDHCHGSETSCLLCHLLHKGNPTSHDKKRSSPKRSLEEKSEGKEGGEREERREKNREERREKRVERREKRNDGGEREEREEREERRE
eukprot:97932-Hanusia_phi.AAC.1